MTDSIEVMLAHKWEPEKDDPTSWWVSEKLDGVRSIWTGEKFISRNGKPFYAPDFFTSTLPTDIVLDGEIFGGRGSFQNTVGVVKSITTRKEEWENLVFMVFDAPDTENAPFEERHKYVLKVAELYPKYIRAVSQVQCLGGKDEILRNLEKIESEGGEGLMLRKPGSFYEGGRTKTLLKVKSCKDLDGIVIEYKEGKGRLSGVMGALICSLRDNPKKTFSVGTGFSDEQRKNPPSLGSIVIVKYQELTKSGIPRFPVYVGVRAD